jgi:hypothetical protein
MEEEEEEEEEDDDDDDDLARFSRPDDLAFGIWESLNYII